MNTIEIVLYDLDQDARPGIVEWIDGSELEQVKAQAAQAGFSVEVRGPVSWRRQLARMENNEGAI